MQKKSSRNSQLIRVAVVDDHQIVIDGLEKIISESNVACLIGKAYNVASCWKMLKAVQPEVLMSGRYLPVIFLCTGRPSSRRH